MATPSPRYRVLSVESVPRALANGQTIRVARVKWEIPGRYEGQIEIQEELATPEEVKRRLDAEYDRITGVYNLGT